MNFLKIAVSMLKSLHPSLSKDYLKMLILTHMSSHKCVKSNKDSSHYWILNFKDLPKKILDKMPIKSKIILMKIFFTENKFSPFLITKFFHYLKIKMLIL